MQVLSDGVREQLRERFSGLRDPVQIRLYVKPGSGRLILPTGMGCQTCEDTRQLLQELVEQAPDHLVLEVVDVTREPLADEGVLDVPLLTLGRSGERQPVRFLGLPSGFEFGMVVEAVEKLSTEAHGLAPESVEALAAIADPVEIMVFATPTCRYCPSAVSLATALAVACPDVTAVTVSANEFPRLSQAFGVQGVPRTVVNRRGAFVGALPEPQFVQAVLQIAGVEAGKAAEPIEEGATSALN